MSKTTRCCMAIDPDLFAIPDLAELIRSDCNACWLPDRALTRGWKISLDTHKLNRTQKISLAAYLHLNGVVADALAIGIVRSTAKSQNTYILETLRQHLDDAKQKTGLSQSQLVRACLDRLRRHGSAKVTTNIPREKQKLVLR